MFLSWKNSSKLKLLPHVLLQKTGNVDHAEWNYRPLLGIVQRLRFRLVCSLLGGSRYRRLLEIGYGSGVFMPELARHCEELFGIDPHAHNEVVQRILVGERVNAKLASCSATSMPYEDQVFDAIVAVSALEFIPDLDKACREIQRVLLPDGMLVVVTPGHSPLADWGLKLLTGKDSLHDFAERRQRILPALERHFRIERRIDFPPFASRILRLYTALQLRNRN